MSDSSESVNLSPEMTIYELMTNSRRRRIIGCLAIAEGWTLTIRQVASHIVALEAAEIPTEIGRSKVTDMNTQLKRRHTGPLETAGIITVDGDAIQPGPHFFEVLPIVFIGEQIDYHREQSENAS